MDHDDDALLDREIEVRLRHSGEGHALREVPVEDVAPGPRPA